MSGSVARLKEQHDEVVAHLLATEPSLATDLGATLAKALVLAGASEIEVDLTDHLIAYFDEVTGGVPQAMSFIKSKGIKRQYHAYFDWETPTANPFFALFGDELKAFARAWRQRDASFDASVKAFLDLGSLRNQIIHKDFAAFSMEMSVDEVYDLYLRAREFCDAVPVLLRLESPAVEG